MSGAIVAAGWASRCSCAIVTVSHTPKSATGSTATVTSRTRYARQREAEPAQRAAHAGDPAAGGSAPAAAVSRYARKWG